MKTNGYKVPKSQSFTAICKCQIFFRRVTRTKKIAWSDGHGSWRATSDDACDNYIVDAFWALGSLGQSFVQSLQHGFSPTVLKHFRRHELFSHVDRCEQI